MDANYLRFEIGDLSRMSGLEGVWNVLGAVLHAAVQVRGDSACFAALAKPLGAAASSCTTGSSAFSRTM
jgi:hypothetical protein